MTRSFLTLLLALSMLPMGVDACLNGFDALLRETSMASRRTFPVPKGHPVDMSDPRIAYNLKTMERLYNRGDYKMSIDYGLYLIYDEQYEKAEETFRKLAEKWPNRYETAANYGTILEVNGKEEEALKWIEKAVGLVPSSHDSSEWIHVNILKAKLNPAQPIDGSHLVGHDFGKGAWPTTKLNEAELTQLQKALFFQLNERVTFIPPKDPYIATLLFELGNVCLLLDDKKSAAKNYALAAKYGEASPLLQVRKDAAEGNLPEMPPLQDTDSIETAAVSQPAPDTTGRPTQPTSSSVETSMPWKGIGIGAALVLLVGLGIWVFRRKGNV